MSYKTEYDSSIANPEKYWAEQAKKIKWFKDPDTILSKDEEGFYRWFNGGKLNTSYLALDYHIENGRGDQDAIIYDSPVTNTIEKYTYKELLEQVSTFAGALKNQGLKKGDTVVIYMPMIPQAAIAMLACARLGLIHSVVFGGFAPRELAIRIDDAKPKLIITASCGIEIDKIITYKPLVDEAIAMAKIKPKTIVYQRKQIKATITENDSDWNELFKSASPASYVELDATDPLYILYTSGTTGLPKGIVRDNGGHAVALRFSLDNIYNAKPGSIFWAASDIGWVVGHSYIVYGPLLQGCTTIMFEGKPIKTPDAGVYWRVIEQHKVNSLFTAPTAIRAIKKEDPDQKLIKKYDVSSLKYLFVAGERCDVDTYNWAKKLLGIPVIDHWWQTESGWPMLANLMGIEPHETQPGSAGKSVPGYNIQILDEEGKEVSANEAGIVAIKLPLPPGTLPTLWNDSKRFKSSYLSTYKGYYLAGDGGYKDENGYVFITGRIDDVINVAGHRLSTSEMEEVIASYPAVAECAVTGIADSLKGQVPAGFVVLKEGVTISEEQLVKDLVKLIREKVGPVAAFKQAAVVKRLPKTRSGKILRKTIRQMADGESFSIPSTIDDPQILDEIKEVMQSKKIGIAFTN